MKHQHSEANILTVIGDDWLEHRRNGVGGTDISAIAGINPWKSALTLYYEKRGELPEQYETERMKWGKLLEDSIAVETAARYGLVIDDCPYILQRPEMPFALASPDRIILDSKRGNGVLEVKNLGHWTAQQVRSGTSEIVIPDHYILQVQWYLFVTGLRWGVFAALLEGSELVTREVERDESLIINLAKLAGDFWRCVENGTPPEPDGSESTSNTLKTLYPNAREDAEPLYLDPGMFLPLLTERAQLKAQEKSVKDRISAIDNIIKAEMKDYAAAVVGDARIYLNTVERKPYTVGGGTYRQLSIK